MEMEPTRALLLWTGLNGLHDEAHCTGEQVLGTTQIVIREFRICNGMNSPLSRDTSLLRRIGIDLHTISIDLKYRLGNLEGGIEQIDPFADLNKVRQGGNAMWAVCRIHSLRFPYHDFLVAQ